MGKEEAVDACLVREDDSSSTSSSCLDIVYLNNASQARLSPKAKQAGIEALSRSDNILSHADEDLRRVRQLFAQLIDASETDISIHPSTSFAITLAAENIYRQLILENTAACTDVKRILVLENQMCSAVYPWQDICQRSNGRLKLDIVPYPESLSWTEAILEQLDENVVVACLPPLHWSDGARVDLVEIGKVCRQKGGIFLIVDSTQATGIMPCCSVKDIQPTMLACSVHKWLRSCSGASLVYLDPALHSAWQPLDQHGRGRDLAGGANHYEAARDEMGKDGYPTRFFPDARKFDGGGKPNPLVVPILRASLEEVVQVNVVQAQLQLKTLVTPLLDWATSHGFSLTNGDRAFHLVGIRPVHLTADEMMEIVNTLEQLGIYIAVRCGAFRVSAYLDNTPEDIDRLIAALEKWVP